MFSFINNYAYCVGMKIRSLMLLIALVVAVGYSPVLFCFYTFLKKKITGLHFVHDFKKVAINGSRQERLELLKILGYRSCLEILVRLITYQICVKQFIPDIRIETESSYWVRLGLNGLFTYPFSILKGSRGTDTERIVDRFIVTFCPIYDIVDFINSERSYGNSLRKKGCNNVRFSLWKRGYVFEPGLN